MTESRKIGVVGSGLIGKSWAMIYAAAGYNVFIYDVLEDQIKNALTDIKRDLHNLEALKLLRGNSSAKEQFNLICGCPDFKKVIENALLVQECVPENLDLKRKVLANIDALADDKVIISSSSSAILPSTLSNGLQHRSQFIVTHPINPPYFVPLVELVPAPWTKEEVCEKVFSVMEHVGQAPVRLKKEINGFALNRLQYVLLNECFHLITDGILDPDAVDQVVTKGLGMRYPFLGPLETAHLNAEGFRNYWERYGETIYGINETLKPPTKIPGPTLDKIIETMEKMVPLEKLAERRKWRDEALIKLSQFATAT